MNNVSVALCTFNGSHFLAFQLESILNQSRKVDEIVICDDGSTDDTLKILKDYQSKYPDLFKVYQNPKRLGVVKNFEKAINLCTKDIILLSDQDDIWMINKVQCTLQFFENHKEYEAVFHDLRIEQNGKVLNQTMWDTVYFEKKFRTPQKLHWYLSYFNNVVTGAALALRKPNSPIFFNVNYQIKKELPYFIHDYLLAIEYSSKGKLGIIEECLVHYRLHSQQAVGTNLGRKSARSPHDLYTDSNVWMRLAYLTRRVQKIKKYNYVSAEITVIIKKLTEERNAIIKDLKISDLLDFSLKVIVLVGGSAKNMFKRYLKIKR